MARGNGKAGRPRDPHLDEALLQAAHEVFLERGYQHASLAEVARKAGVGTPAIYRRWPTKAALAIDIVERESGPEPIPDTGSIRRDLAEFFRLRLRTWGRPLVHQVVLPLVLEATADNELGRQIRQRVAGYRQTGVETRLLKAIKTGELRRDTKPARLADMLLGPITVALLFGQNLPAAPEARYLVNHILDGFASRD